MCSVQIKWNADVAYSPKPTLYYCKDSEGGQMRGVTQNGLLDHDHGRYVN